MSSLDSSRQRRPKSALSIISVKSFSSALVSFTIENVSEKFQRLGQLCLIILLPLTIIAVLSGFSLSEELHIRNQRAVLKQSLTDVRMYGVLLDKIQGEKGMACIYLTAARYMSE